MPLTMAKRGESYIIRRIGGKPDVRRHLENLGFVEGAEVTVVQEIDGNIIVSVKGARIAIGKELAAKIIV